MFGLHDLADIFGIKDARTKQVCLEARVQAFYTGQMRKARKRKARAKETFASTAGLLPTDPPPLGMKMPTSLEDAMATPWAPQFQAAWNKEILGMQQRGVWEVVPITAECLPLIGSKTIFDIKRDAEGNVDRFKSRIVGQGCSQVDGVNYDSTDIYSPVVTLVVVRMLLTIFAAIADVTFHHLDISQAYLWATLDTPVYMRAVNGMQLPAGHCLKLLRALYGLKGSATAWYRTFVKALTSAPLSYVQSRYDQCVFYRSVGQHFLILLLFVDDMLAIYLKDELVTRCNQLFAVDDRGEAKWFLAIQIERNIAEGYVDLSRAVLQRLV